MTRCTKIAVGFGVFFLGLASIVLRIAPPEPLSALRTDYALVDFDSSVFYPTVAFWAGDIPYDRETFTGRYPVYEAFPIYAPASFLVHGPLAFFDRPLAAGIYLTANLLLTVALAFVALRATGRRVESWHVAAAAGLIMLSRPGGWNLLLGQPTVPMVLATYAAFYARERRPLVSGLALAFTLIKLPFGLPLTLLLLGLRAYKAVFVGGLTALAVNLVPLGVLVRRAGGIEDFRQIILENVEAWTQLTSPGGAASRVDLTAFVGRFLESPPPTLLVATLALGVLGAALLLFRRAERAFPSWLPKESILLLAMLLATHHQSYDLLLLTLPAACFVARAVSGASHGRMRAMAASLLLLLLAANYLVSPTFKNLLGLSQVSTLPFASANALALLGLFFILTSYTAVPDRHKDREDSPLPS